MTYNLKRTKKFSCPWVKCSHPVTSAWTVDTLRFFCLWRRLKSCLFVCDVPWIHCTRIGITITKAKLYYSKYKNTTIQTLWALRHLLRKPAAITQKVRLTCSASYLVPSNCQLANIVRQETAATRLVAASTRCRTTDNHSYNRRQVSGHRTEHVNINNRPRPQEPSVFTSS